MEAVLYLLAAAIISYVASLQLGPVNLRVIQSTIQLNKGYALRVGFGGSLPELLYAGIAFYITELIDFESFDGKWLSFITLPVFIFLAIYNFRKKDTTSTRDPNALPPSNRKGFLEGFALAMLNPQLITFWLVIIAFFKTKGVLVDATFMQQSFFVAGTAIGAFVLQLTFIALASKYKNQIMEKMGKNFNKIIGGLFLLLAIVDATKLLYNLL